MDELQEEDPQKAAAVSELLEYSGGGVEMLNTFSELSTQKIKERISQYKTVTKMKTEPFKGEASGGYVKKYAHGGGVRKAKFMDS